MGTGVVGRLKKKRHLSAEEFAYARRRTQRTVKVTIPSPLMLAYYWVPGVSDSVYPSTEVFLEDVAAILRDEVAELVRLGCEYVQVDAPELSSFIDPHQAEWMARRGFAAEWALDQGIELINSVIAGHEGVTFGMHVCRGNIPDLYMAVGSYGPIARAVFQRSAVHRLLLEYDDERSGDFEPLALVPDDKVVVLGLITTKFDRDEREADLVARIERAAKYVPLERLALSPQCGFATGSTRAPFAIEVEEVKLRLAASVAKHLWG
jgi:5-methyltetrahydropteroyltriglutamate--homocysteine methyltransferase